MNTLTKMLEDLRKNMGDTQVVPRSFIDQCIELSRESKPVKIDDNDEAFVWIVLDRYDHEQLTFHPPVSLSETPNGHPRAWLIGDGTEAYFNKDAARDSGSEEPRPLYEVATIPKSVPVVNNECIELSQQGGERVMQAIEPLFWQCRCWDEKCGWKGTEEEATFPDPITQGDTTYTACPNCLDINVSERMPIEPSDFRTLLDSIRTAIDPLFISPEAPAPAGIVLTDAEIERVASATVAGFPRNPDQHIDIAEAERFGMRTGLRYARDHFAPVTLKHQLGVMTNTSDEDFNALVDIVCDRLLQAKPADTFMAPKMNEALARMSAASIAIEYLENALQVLQKRRETTAGLGPIEHEVKEAIRALKP